MKMWKYLRIESRNNYIVLTGNDGDVLIPIMIELKKLFKNVEVHEKQGIGDPASPGLCFATVRKLNPFDDQVAVWMVGMLGKQGWEPFSVERGVDLAYWSYSLRYEYQ